MQERIIEIIVYLLEEFDQQYTQASYSDISKKLISRGYTENEINLAFSWIFNHLQKNESNRQEEFHYKTSSNRVLHDLERLIISAEAYGYLLQLKHLRMVSDFELELIIEKALAMGTSDIDIEDIKSIAASIIFGSDASNSWDGFFSQGTNTIH